MDTMSTTTLHHTTFGRREPKRVFFDFGANRGDSLTSFTSDVRAMGGTGITGLGKEGKWDLWGFEANPHFTPQLKALEEKLNRATLPSGDKQYNVFMRPESAITTKNGPITFYLDTVNKAASFWGSSLLEKHHDVVKSGKKNVTVQGYAISQLIMENYSKDDYIIVKMDVEGSEFDLLTDLMLTGAIHYVDLLLCEYHRSLAPVEGMEKTLKYQIGKAGVKQGSWD